MFIYMYPLKFSATDHPMIVKVAMPVIIKPDVSTVSLSNDRAICQMIIRKDAFVYPYVLFLKLLFHVLNRSIHSHSADSTRTFLFLGIIYHQLKRHYRLNNNRIHHQRFYSMIWKIKLKIFSLILNIRLVNIKWKKKVCTVGSLYK
jgi:hypothetical protein